MKATKTKLAPHPESLDERRALWIFGYGSLLWRPAFAHTERRPAFVRGWTRRFWQGSTDHRGVPGRPGRVVTLEPEPAGRCDGVVYRVAPDAVDAVLATLDHREKGGYQRHRVAARLTQDPAREVSALLYVATADNDEYLGPAPTEEIVEQILVSRGPSGANLEYVLELAAALRALGASDEHVFDIEARLRQRGDDPQAQSRTLRRAPARP